MADLWDRGARLHALDSLGKNIVICAQKYCVIYCAKLYNVVQYHNIQCNIEKTPAGSSQAAADEKLNPDFPTRSNKTAKEVELRGNHHNHHHHLQAQAGHPSTLKKDFLMRFDKTAKPLRACGDQIVTLRHAGHTV